MAIPKIVHWVQLGEPNNNPVVKECRDSMRAMNPSFDFRLHTDNSVFEHPYFDGIRPALYAFYDLLDLCRRQKNPLELKSDLIRQCVVYTCGGIALDQDLYACQPLDRFLNDDLLIAEHRPTFIVEAVMGAAAHSRKMYDFINWYITRNPDGTGSNRHVCSDMSSVVQFNNWFAYPAEYFIPWLRQEDEANWYKVTKNTHTVHLWKQHTYDMDRIRDLPRVVRELNAA